MYLYGDSLKAPGLLSGRRPWGLEHKNEGSACFAGEVLEEVVPDMLLAEVSGRAEQQHYGQTPVPGKYRHYLLDNSDRQPPTKETLKCK